MNKTPSTHRQTLARRLKRDVQRMAALLESSDDDGLDGFALHDLGLSASEIGSMQAEWSGDSPFTRQRITVRDWL